MDWKRRDVLKGASAVLGGMAGSGLVSGSAIGAEQNHQNGDRPGSDRIVAGAGIAVVETASGKVAGFERRGIFTFKGIPYADTTEGTNRFMPPAPVKAWTGVRSSRYFGHVSPQGPRGGWSNDEESFLFRWDDGIQGEDCLRINLWTPAVNDGKKRPVMVWLHGGGFSAGSGQELPSYDGENLARRGEVVVVSLNHRLNAFGYLNLADYGEKYAHSANVGMLDIVAALEWIRDNIAGFGGDAKSVTIFGQSGGGGKVGALMAMPAAKGLFHRAIVESGSMLKVGTQERSRELAGLVVAELGIERANIDQLQTVPFQKLVEVSAAVLAKHNPRPAGSVPNFRRMASLMGWGPVLDEKVLPAHPFDPVASELSADVPMIVGTVLNEFVNGINHPEVESMTNEDVETRVKGMFGENAPKVLAAFRERVPGAKPFDVWSHIAASTVRENAIKQCRAKTALGKAPAYLYWFTWQTPVLDGRPRAFHCAELAFVFDNTERCETMTGNGERARALAAKMSEAWIQFARTGNPSHAGIPAWTPFAAETVPTIIFDDEVRLVNYPDRGEQQSIAEA